MTTESEKTGKVDQVADPFYKTAQNSAVVAGIFAAVICILLVITYLQITLLDPLRAERLEHLKLQFFEQPQNEDLKSQIRQLDLTVRKDAIRHRNLMAKGSILFLGAIVVCLIGIKTAAIRNSKKVPFKKTDADLQQGRQAALTGWAVMIGLGILACVVLLWPTAGMIELKGEGTSVKQSYPSEEEIAANWPSFRGAHGSGVSASADIPETWDVNSGKGILWKSEIPLPGHNSPVVWKDKVFLSGADQKKRQVYCFDATSGKLLWQGDVEAAASGAKEELKLEEATGYAASTMATNGKYVCAIFPTGDVACFTYDGKRVWSKNLGRPESMYGYASSLVMYRGLVLIQYDQAAVEDNKSFLLALDTSNGTTVWQTRRPVGSSWSSPIIINVKGRDQIITCSDPWVIAYDPANGSEIWRAEGLGSDLAPSPIYAAPYVFAMQPNSKLFAIDPNGSGDVTKTHIAWEVSGSIPEICSPVSNGEFIFTLGSQGTLTCYKAADGKEMWQENFNESFLASPSLVGDCLYLLSENGCMFIAKVGSECKKMDKSDLGEKCYASLAFSNGRIYIRASKNLYCMGNNK